MRRMIRPRPRLTIWVLVAAVVMAVTTGLAQALPAPDDRDRSYEVPSNAQLDQQDRLGPKYVTTHFPAPTNSVDGNDAGASMVWRAEWVIAGIVALALALAAAARLLRHRRARDQAQKRLAAA